MLRYVTLETDIIAVYAKAKVVDATIDWSSDDEEDWLTDIKAAFKLLRTLYFLELVWTCLNFIINVSNFTTMAVTSTHARAELVTISISSRVCNRKQYSARFNFSRI